MNPHLEERHGFEHCSSVDIRVRRLDLWVSMRLGKFLISSVCMTQGAYSPPLSRKIGAIDGGAQIRH